MEPLTSSPSVLPLATVDVDVAAVHRPHHQAGRRRHLDIELHDRPRDRRRIEITLALSRQTAPTAASTTRVHRRRSRATARRRYDRDRHDRLFASMTTSRPASGRDADAAVEDVDWMHRAARAIAERDTQGVAGVCALADAPTMSSAPMANSP